MSNTTNMDFLKNFPLFDCLTEEDFAIMETMVESHTKPKYSFLYLTNEPSDAVFFLSKGIIKTGTHSDDGREVIKSILHPISMFGELGLVGEQERTEFARAMNQEVKYCTIKVVDFKRLMHRNHELSMKIMQIVGKRLMKAENRLEALIFKDARARIIDFLKDSVLREGRKVGYEMLLKHCLTQQDIANITGTSRQTVTSVLNELRKENLIYFNRRTILIRDMERLA